jgi:hypothetical protein
VNGVEWNDGGVGMGEEARRMMGILVQRSEMRRILLQNFPRCGCVLYAYGIVCSLYITQMP